MDQNSSTINFVQSSFGYFGLRLIAAGLLGKLVFVVLNQAIKFSHFLPDLHKSAKTDHFKFGDKRVAGKLPTSLVEQIRYVKSDG